MKDIIKTKDIERVGRMAQAVMASEYARVGRIGGESGTGKTQASYWLQSNLNALRVCASDSMTRKTLLQRLATALGMPDMRGSTDTLLATITPLVKNRLIVVDEGNHLRWHHMELLRYLPDEAGAGLILTGTELLNRQFKDGRTAIYLKQLSRRIGAKQVVMGQMSLEQVAGYVLMPRFGQHSKTTAKKFFKGCDGYWGESGELADACERVMEVQGISKLNDTVVDAAVLSMANQG